MLSEVLEAFEGSPGGWFIDGTFGLGGHSRGLLERYPDRKVFGIDLDAQSTRMSRKGFQKFTDRVLLVNGNYAFISERSVRHRARWCRSWSSPGTRGRSCT